MDRSVNFDINLPLMEAGLDPSLSSPADEDSVHDSFSQLIAEQSQNGGPPDALEMRRLQRELDEEGRDEVPYLSRPPRVLTGRREAHGESDDLLTPADPLVGERWSSATLKILSSMPSRTIGRSRGAILSQYYNRTMQLRRRKQSRPSIRDFSRSARPSILSYVVEMDSADTDGAEVRKRERLVNNLQNLSVGDRVRMLREMPLSVAEKSNLRRSIIQKEKRATDAGSKLHCCSRVKYYIIIALRQSWYSWLSFLHSLQLWQVLLKRVGGRFGSGVLSYFVFLRTLLFFNLFLFLVTGAFMVLPQAVHPPEASAERRSFSGLELLTGAGRFSDSVMYYGYYCNYTLCRDDGRPSNVSVFNSTEAACGSATLSYNMPLAYFFTIGAGFFIKCIILVYSMSKSFGRSFRIDKSHSVLAVKVFCSWDFKVIKKTSVKLMCENICTQLKELLAEVNHKRRENTACQKLGRLMVHGLAWTICIVSTAACVTSIYFFSDYMHQERFLNGVSLLALPVVVSVINLLLPGLFNLSAWMEEYDSPSTRTYVAISRNLMLKVSVLCVLCYHWLGRVPAKQDENHLECWESFVGQELYRFLLMDFVFSMMDTLFGEFLWRLFSEKLLKRRRKPVFDIARNVLELIYGQTLAWLGVLFAPLLPAVQVLKLFLLFYIKMSSVLMNCQAPRRPYRVSQMTTIFITLLCFPSFLGASVCVTYTMWSIAPSSSCGPFRGLTTMFQAGKQWVKQLEQHDPSLSVLARAHSYLVENPFFLFVGAGIFLVVIYFHSQVLDGQRKIITLLQEQIQNEGEDKKFLITRLQSIHEQKRTPTRRLLSQDSAC